MVVVVALFKWLFKKNLFIIIIIIFCLLNIFLSSSQSAFFSLLFPLAACYLEAFYATAGEKGCGF